MWYVAQLHARKVERAKPNILTLEPEIAANNHI
jgi:hypothetical protein